MDARINEKEEDMCKLRGVGGVLYDTIGAVMLVAGPAMVIRGCSARKEIRSELVAQRIMFPRERGLPDGLAALAGQRVETGAQARAYSDVIKIHLGKATEGRTYSEISADLITARSNGYEDDKLSELQRTAFMGETLRGSLMSAYEAWQLTSLVSGLGVLFTGLGAALLAARQR